MKKVDIYTDGACSGNPGPGGWGAIPVSYTHLDVYKRQDKYTPVTAEPFTTALTEAKAVKEDGDAMQDDVTTAESALLEAMMNLRYRACLLYTSRCV